MIYFLLFLIFILILFSIKEDPYPTTEWLEKYFED